jgi:hypothetical protein
MDDTGKISDTQRFFSLFRGNSKFYVKHQAPFHAEDSGKIKGSWVGIAKDKSVVLSPTIEKYREHLQGGDGIAIQPLMANNKCFFAVVDIDVYGVNYTSLVQRLRRYGFKFAPFPSKSGGLHIYFFFKDEEKGKGVIAALTRFVDTFGLGRLYTSDKGKSKVEIFPKHAVIDDKSLGSCVFLPFYNAANPANCKQKLLTSEGKLLGIVKGIDAIEGSFTSVKEIEELIDALPYGDAPYCVQMLSLTGALAEGDGRNDFIYQVGVYLRKKQKENFLGEMLKINAELVEPQPEGDVEATYRSVMEKQLEYKCKTGPCAEFCDTKQCRKREYGVGKDKGNHFTGFAQWGEISRVMAAEPYYLWKVQVDEGGPIQEIRIDGETDLMLESVVARSCVRCVNRAPLMVKINDWIDIVNQSLLGIESRQIEVPKSTDTTETSQLARYFTRYLTHRQIQSGRAQMVMLGQVYHEDGHYYFTVDGFKDYLRIQKFSVGRLNLREELIKLGCTAGSVKYKVSSGEKIIECWKKPDDDELEKMGTFYTDVLDSDKVVVADNTLDKVDDSFDTADVPVEGLEGGDDGRYNF